MTTPISLQPCTNKFLSLSDTIVVAIFPNLCLWRYSYCSNLGGVDPEKLYRNVRSLNYLLLLLPIAAVSFFGWHQKSKLFSLKLHVCVVEFTHESQNKHCFSRLLTRHFSLGLSPVISGAAIEIHLNFVKVTWPY